MVKTSSLGGRGPELNKKQPHVTDRTQQKGAVRTRITLLIQ